MRLRWLAAFGVLLGTAVPATAASTVHVSGRVVDGSGRGVAGALVSFELHPDPNIYDQTNCPVRRWAVECQVHKIARRTDPAGRFRIPVRLASYVAAHRRHDLFVTDAPSRGVLLPAHTHFPLFFKGQSLALPDVPVWRPRVTLGTPDPAGRRLLHVGALPASYGPPYGPGKVAELVQGTAAVWRFEKVTADREVDARLVEAGTTGVRALAMTHLKRFPMTYRSPVYAVTGAVRPLSRGAACATYGPGDTPIALAGCKFTDGRLAQRIPVAYQRAGGKACDVAAQCPNARHVRVDLGSAQPVTAAVVRGCAAGEVEWSLDGTTFLPLVTRDAGDGLAAGPPVPARYVRVDLSRCTFNATEVSVFGP